jgi:hypothetical protein
MFGLSLAHVVAKTAALCPLNECVAAPDLISHKRTTGLSQPANLYVISMTAYVHEVWLGPTCNHGLL